MLPTNKTTTKAELQYFGCDTTHIFFLLGTNFLHSLYATHTTQRESWQEWSNQSFLKWPRMGAEIQPLILGYSRFSSTTARQINSNSSYFSFPRLLPNCLACALRLRCIDSQGKTSDYMKGGERKDNTLTQFYHLALTPLLSPSYLDNNIHISTPLHRLSGQRLRAHICRQHFKQTLSVYPRS
jgi:hypothetical protein